MIVGVTGAGGFLGRALRRTLGDAFVSIPRDGALDGPVDAIYSAIARLTGVRASLTDYHIRAVTKGQDANLKLE